MGGGFFLMDKQMEYWLRQMYMGVYVLGGYDNSKITPVRLFFCLVRVTENEKLYIPV